MPLMKELQRLISFRCYNDVHGSGNSKKTIQLQDTAAKKCHGVTQLTQPSQEEDHVSYSDQFLKGTGMFEFLFRVEQDFQEGDDVLVLKEMFSCQNINRIVVSDKKTDQGINKAVVTSKSMKNRSNITGRNIWDNGKVVERNGKKALALLEHSEHKQHMGDGKTPSGNTYEDCLLFIRRAMYKELKGEKDEEETDDIDDNDSNSVQEDEDDDMPETHFFPGCLAFALWGPIVPPGLSEEYKCQVFFSSEQSKDCLLYTSDAADE